MADSTAIEWTDATWNPVTGCTKITAGCDNCYAARFSERFRGVPGHPFEMGFDLTLRPDRLLQPFTWKRPRMIFVNSMSDLFHKEIPKQYIAAVFDTMEKANWHTYQILTKRSSLLRKFVNDRYQERVAPAHMWFGVSVENEQAKSRIVHLQKANASVRFLSVEPLIAPIGKLNLQNIHWVIVGGESGPRARPMKKEWVVDVRNQCVNARVSFFFKQWGGRSPKSGGRVLDGKTWSQFPQFRELRVDA
jgi:protein gp37